MWAPQTIAKLVQLTSITMVYDTYNLFHNYIHGVFVNQHSHHWGGLTLYAIQKPDRSPREIQRETTETAVLAAKMSLNSLGSVSSFRCCSVNESTVWG